jgi:4-hydroxythreonine-4-phosphate dehydrogenase
VGISDNMNATIAPLALTMGEPAGIGGECTIRAWQTLRHEQIPFFLIGDPEYIAALAHQLGRKIAVAEVETADEASDAFATALPVLPIRLGHPVTLGQPHSRNSKTVISSIERAVALTASGEASAVVTNPIQKSTLYEAGFSYPGHTEFLALWPATIPAPS